MLSNKSLDLIRHVETKLEDILPKDAFNKSVLAKYPTSHFDDFPTEDRERFLFRTRRRGVFEVFLTKSTVFLSAHAHMLNAYIERQERGDAPSVQEVDRLTTQWLRIGGQIHTCLTVLMSDVIMDTLTLSDRRVCIVGYPGTDPHTPFFYSVPNETCLVEAKLNKAAIDALSLAIAVYAEVEAANAMLLADCVVGDIAVEETLSAHFAAAAANTGKPGKPGKPGRSYLC